MRKFLFVGGMARSGTSALCELLNRHPALAIGMERYKYSAGSGELFRQGPAAFEREAFFDIRPSQTNIAAEGGKYQRLYREMAARYDQAEYVGDKVPAYYRQVDRLIGAFPGARVVLIWRPLEDVAMSWDRRSRDASSWPSHNDADAAVEHGEEAMACVLAAGRAHPEAVRIVGYRRLFAGAGDDLLRLAAWLGIEAVPSYLRGVAEARRKAARLDLEREPVRPDIRRRVDRPELCALERELDEISA